MIAKLKTVVWPQNRWACVVVAALVYFSLPQNIHAQRYSISGTITDQSTGEVLIGTNVTIPALDLGTITNRYGFYSITLPHQDSVAVVFSYIGFEPQVKKIFLSSSVALDVQLAPRTETLEGVTVTADQLSNENVRSTQMGVIDVPVKMIEAFPAILGEQDVLKVIQLLPGVQGGQEGTTGFYVRGGNIDQNLVLLDEATVYNPNHLFGLFSTFNSRALNGVELVKGGFPANYGGRLSSVVEISMREGNKNEYVVDGGIGVLSSRLAAEGPIRKGKSSFIISSRRSYLDLVAKPFQKTGQKNKYYFYDINGKVNATLSSRDRAYLSFFRGRDVADYVGVNGLGYGIRFGNTAITGRWNHVFGPKLFSNFSFIRNQYLLRISTVQSQFFSLNHSSITDLTAKAEFEYYPTPGHNIVFGGLVSDHTFKSTGSDGEVLPGNVIPAFSDQNIVPTSALEGAAYVNDKWEIGKQFGINFGVRLPFYNASDTSYVRLEPRLSVRVGVDDQSSIKASYTAMNQFVHSVPSTTASLPTDLWIPSSKIVKPQYSEQVALGYFRNFSNKKFETSVEAYYKWMRKQVQFKQGTQLLEYANIENELTFGKGWSYGAEFYLRKAFGRSAGWISYTWSKTDQQFPELNFGRKFPFRYDRRHNLSVSGMYDLTSRLDLSANFIFQTGSAYTLPTGRIYGASGGDLYSGVFYDYTSLNNYRLRSYHRLDIAATYNFKPKRLKESELVIGFYNLYSRLNPYYVFLDVDLKTNQPIGRQVSLLPILPSITYNLTF